MSTFEEKMDKKMDKLKIMDKSNGQIGNNGQIMDKNDLKWILNGLNGNHTLVFRPFLGRSVLLLK